MIQTTNTPRPLGTEPRKGGILIVVPPFHGVGCPALGASQLKANLDAAGYPTELLYLSLRFADKIDVSIYEWLSGTGKHLLGDFIFSFAVFDRDRADVDKYIADVLGESDFARAFQSLFPGEELSVALNRLIDHAVEFIHGEAIEAIQAREPWMVGLSSVFESVTSSLAVMREVKAKNPEILTMIGGPNCTGSMGEVMREQYDFIDYVARGESDTAVVDLIKALRAKESTENIQGFLPKDGPINCAASPLMSEQLDAQPIPDFTEFFQTLSEVSFSKRVKPGLAMETSRGCWWGEKHHCTFCAFNRDGMIFRSKSSERVLEEMRAHTESWDLPRMELTDNILDMGYFNSVVKTLAESPVGHLFWETKANLTREQVEMMAQAGIRWIQPGLESLSDKTLQLMDKGSTQLQNVQLLKYCSEHGVRITWNWLYGFPGEDESEIDDLRDAVRSCHHLQPPGCTTVLYLERFSPYHDRPNEWGLTGIRPVKSYGHIYPTFDEETLDRLAFFFDCHDLDVKEQSPSYGQLKDVVSHWQHHQGQSHLITIERSKSTVILDTRPHGGPFFRRLKGLKKKIYDLCWKIRGESKIIKACPEAQPEEVSRILAGFVADRLMLSGPGRDGNTLYLSLAIDPRTNYKKYIGIFPGGHLFSEGYDPDAKQTNADGDLPRKLLHAATMRIPPRQLAGALKRKLRQRVMDGLVNRLSVPK